MSKNRRANKSRPRPHIDDRVISGDVDERINKVFSTGTQQTIVNIPKTVRNFFPSTLRCWGTTVYQYAQSGTVGDSLTFKLNGPFNLFGPRINNAGAFGANVPSGSQYLIGSDAASGAATPYTRALVLRQEIQISMMCGASNAVPILLYCTFGTNLTNAGMTVTQIQEQPLTSYLTSGCLTSAAPVILEASTHPATALGVNKVNYHETREYGQVAGVDPAALAYVLIGLRSVDAATNCTAFLTIRFRTLFEFSEPNAYGTTAPVLGSLTPSCPSTDYSNRQPTGRQFSADGWTCVNHAKCRGCGDD